MKLFLLKSLLFTIVFSICCTFALSFASGATDPFYIRFTTPKQTNLILGTSRAAQGLQPKIITPILNQRFFNYSFTNSHSPFGPAYLKSIKKKLQNNTKNGTFIITVDPWSISSVTSNPNDSLSFREVEGCVGNMNYVNLNPNIPYILKNLNGKYLMRVFRPNTSMFLHKDGWLEITVDMDSIALTKRINSKLKNYRSNNLPYYRYSEVRMKYLVKTIKLLKKHGSVYLVRLPIHEKMMEIEKELMPDFDNKIGQITHLTNGYLDLTINNEKYEYTDGNHLYKESGKEISETIAMWIKNIKRTHNGQNKKH